MYQQVALISGQTSNLSCTLSISISSNNVLSVDFFSIQFMEVENTPTVKLCRDTGSSAYLHSGIYNFHQYNFKFSNYPEFNLSLFQYQHSPFTSQE